MEKNKSTYTFKRLRRSNDWEDKKRNVLEQNGLIITNENSFVFPETPTTFIPCLQWLSANKNFLFILWFIHFN